MFANLDTTGRDDHLRSHRFRHAQTIDLTLGQLELENTSETEAIVGSAAGVTVDAGDSSRVFQVDASVTASISGLTMGNGNLSAVGGGLLNDGTLTLTDCTVSGSMPAYNGGGIMNLGDADADRFNG